MTTTRPKRKLTEGVIRSDLARRNEVKSTKPTPGWAVIRELAPYPRLAKCSSPLFFVWSWGLWQCQNSIISAQFSLGRSFHTFSVPSLTTAEWQVLHTIAEPGSRSNADHGMGSSDRGGMRPVEAPESGNLHERLVLPPLTGSCVKVAITSLGSWIVSLDPS